MSKSSEQIVSEMVITLNDIVLNGDYVGYYFTMMKYLRYSIENRKAIRAHFTTEEEELAIRLFTFRVTHSMKIRSRKSAEKYITNYIRGKINKAMMARVNKLEETNVE